jgi:hypothetical protein
MSEFGQDNLLDEFDTKHNKDGGYVEPEFDMSSIKPVE